MENLSTIKTAGPRFALGISHIEIILINTETPEVVMGTISHILGVVRNT
jgi:hypothetical protein